MKSFVTILAFAATLCAAAPVNLNDLFSGNLLGVFGNDKPTATPTPAAGGANDNAGVAVGECKDVMVVFARGTTEPGTQGIVIGPSFNNALNGALNGKVDFQGIPYAADIPGFLVGGDPAGSKTMADLVEQTASKCPKAKIVMSGYSQGAQLVHNAVKQLPANSAKNVAAVVMFGDPDFKRPLGKDLDDKTKVFCNDGDLICAGQPIILPAHLTYSLNADEAAKFVAGKVGGR